MKMKALRFSLAVVVGLVAVLAALTLLDGEADVAWAQGGTADLWTVNDDVATTTLNTPVSLNVLANDSVVTGNVLLGYSVGPPANGAATIMPYGTVTYTPTADFLGTDTFTYTVMVCPAGSPDPPYTQCTVITDKHGNVTIQVSGTADLWTVNDDVATTTLNTPVSLNVLDNDSVAGSNVLRGDSVGPPAIGTATIIPDGTVTYTPTADFLGTDTFTYTVMVCPAGAADPPYTQCTVITEKHGNVTIQVRPSRLYLPVIRKAGPLTQLFVTSHGTGGISRLEIWSVFDDVLVHYCENIPNDAVQYPCGSFPPGTHRVVAYTVNCGVLEAQKTWAAGPVTIQVYCN